MRKAIDPRHHFYLPPLRNTLSLPALPFPALPFPAFSEWLFQYLNLTVTKLLLEKTTGPRLLQAESSLRR